MTRYIALSPVDGGIVARPEEWAWSSYRARAGYEQAPSWLAIDPVLNRFGDDRASQQRAYREFVDEGIGNPHDIMNDVVGQMFLDTAAWIDKVQKLLDGEERSEEHAHAFFSGRRAARDASATGCDASGVGDAACGGR